MKRRGFVGLLGAAVAGLAAGLRPKVATSLGVDLASGPDETVITAIDYDLTEALRRAYSPAYFSAFVNEPSPLFASLSGHTPSRRAFVYRQECDRSMQGRRRWRRRFR